MAAWGLQDIPDLTGKVAVVTGASSGIGLVTARELAARGAYVVLACRDVGKGEAARATMAANTEVRLLDLADLDSVRSFAAGVHDWRIDILVNNAGVLTDRLARTAAGHEIMFGTNVLGPFLLTQLLLGHGAITDRVVWVASLAHRSGRRGLDLTDLDWHRRRLSPHAYGATKLADLVLAYEQQRRFVAAGSTLRSLAAHPGWSATNLFAGTASPLAARAVGAFAKLPLLAQSADGGALPTLYAATDPHLAGGTYIGPGGPGELQGAPRPVGSSAASHDRDLAQRLWAACEELTGLYHTPVAP